MNKKHAAAILALILVTGASAVSGKQKNTGLHERLLGLYRADRYFEFRDALAGMEYDASPEMFFFRAAEANAFNRLEEAIVGLLAYLQRGPLDPPRPLAHDAWVLLADTYRRAGQYRRAAEAYRRILERFGARLDASDRANYGNQKALWSALAGVPPQTAEVLRDSVIPLEKRSFPVRIKDKTLYFWYDTGSSLSVLYESAARELGLTVLDPGTKIQTATGAWVDSRLAVAPELRLGEAVVRNVVFLILPDAFFPVREVRPGVVRRGLVGAPILAALKEFIETREGHILIPASPPPRPLRNMCFFGFMPIVELVHRGKKLPLCLDTGSSATFLYPPFFRRYRVEIKSRSRMRRITMGAVGNSRAIPVHILDEFAFRVGGRDVSLRRIVVHTKETHDRSEIFDGVLGMDVLARCSRMIFNFESMSFILE